MNKPLIDVIFASEKRTNVLLLLQDGEKEMKDFLTALDTSRTGLIPQIRILEEHNLVSQDGDTYKLTPIGKLIVGQMDPLVSTVNTLGVDTNYWGTHIMDFIPPHLLERIGEMGECNTITPAIPETHYITKQFHESSRESGVLYSINTFFHPNFVELFEDLVRNNVEIHFILSQNLLDNMTNDYNKIFNSLIATNKFHFYLHPKDLGFMSLGVNKHYLKLTSLRTDGSFDNKRILCNSQTAVEWGIELFNYFLKDATPINEV